MKPDAKNPGMTTKPSNTTLVLSVGTQQKTASGLTARNAAKDGGGKS